MRRAPAQKDAAPLAVWVDAQTKGRAAGRTVDLFAPDARRIVAQWDAAEGGALILGELLDHVRSECAAAPGVQLHARTWEAGKLVASCTVGHLGAVPSREGTADAATARATALALSALKSTADRGDHIWQFLTEENQRLRAEVAAKTDRIADMDRAALEVRLRLEDLLDRKHERTVAMAAEISENEQRERATKVLVDIAAPVLGNIARAVGGKSTTLATDREIRLLRALEPLLTEETEGALTAVLGPAAADVQKALRDMADAIPGATKETEH